MSITPTEPRWSGFCIWPDTATNDFPLEKSPVFIKHNVLAAAFRQLPLSQRGLWGNCEGSLPPPTPGGPQWKEGNRKQGANTYMSLRGRTKTIYRLERDRSLVWLDFCTLWRTVWFMCWSFLTHKAVPVSHIIWEWEKTDFRPTHPSWRKRDTGQGNTKLRKEEYY